MKVMVLVRISPQVADSSFPTLQAGSFSSRENWNRGWSNLSPSWSRSEKKHRLQSKELRWYWKYFSTTCSERGKADHNNQAKTKGVWKIKKMLCTNYWTLILDSDISLMPFKKCCSFSHPPLSFLFQRRDSPNGHSPCCSSGRADN
jgi:hypothetical protein